MYLLNYLQALQVLEASLQNALASLESAKASFYYISTQNEYSEIAPPLSLEDLEGLSELLDKVRTKISLIQESEAYTKEMEGHYF